MEKLNITKLRNTNFYTALGLKAILESNKINSLNNIDFSVQKKELESIVNSKKGDKIKELEKLREISNIYFKLTDYVDPLTIKYLIDTEIIKDVVNDIYSIYELKEYTKKAN